jgi:hypothetical protein
MVVVSLISQMSTCALSMLAPTSGWLVAQHCHTKQDHRRPALQNTNAQSTFSRKDGPCGTYQPSDVDTASTPSSIDAEELSLTSDAYSEAGSTSHGEHLHHDRSVAEFGEASTQVDDEKMNAWADFLADVPGATTIPGSRADSDAADAPLVPSSTFSQPSRFIHSFTMTANHFFANDENGCTTQHRFRDVIVRFQPDRIVVEAHDLCGSTAIFQCSDFIDKHGLFVDTDKSSYKIDIHGVHFQVTLHLISPTYMPCSHMDPANLRGNCMQEPDPLP